MVLSQHLWLFILLLNIYRSLQQREISCKIDVIHPQLFIAGIPPTSQSIKPGHMLRFNCGGNYRMTGPEEIECLQSGEWNSPFPTCSGSDCSSPPLLENGDITDVYKQKYKHDEKVEYVCQAWHIMEGGPFRKCVDGEWTGEITCLKPCTLNQDDMTDNNIQLISGEGKIYSEHGDHITFECTRRKSRVGSVAFRQMCKDGVITLPRCE
ncbi:complement factor H-related protein 2-like [Menidia menidia]